MTNQDISEALAQNRKAQAICITKGDIDGLECLRRAEAELVELDEQGGAWPELVSVLTH